MISALVDVTSFRKLLSPLIALAVLFAPALSSATAAQSAMPDHQIQMMEAGHCHSMPSGHHDKSDGKTCCISVTIGIAFAPCRAVAELRAPAPRPVSSVPTLHRPYLGEIATPPPRVS